MAPATSLTALAVTALTLVASVAAANNVTIVATSYNMNIIRPGNLVYSSERWEAARVAVIAAAADTDVMCIQGVLHDPDLRELSAGIASELPYQRAQVDPQSSSSSMNHVACSNAGAVFAFGLCALQSCQDEFDAAADAPSNFWTALNCAMTSCEAQYTIIYNDPSCMGCLLTDIAAGGDGFACMAEDSKHVRYDNMAGLMIASRYPLYNKHIQLLPSAFGARAILTAEIEPFEGASRLAVACTDMAGSNSDGYAGFYGSWENDAAVHIAMLNNTVLRNERTPSQLLLMGSLGVGPAIADVGGFAIDVENSAAWTALADAEDWGMPYLDVIQADDAELTTNPCTWCGGEQAGRNPLIDAGGKNQIITQVLLRGEVELRNSTVRAVRLFDDNDAVQITDDLVGPTSDHYGVEVEFVFTQGDYGDTMPYEDPDTSDGSPDDPPDPNDGPLPENDEGDEGDGNNNADGGGGGGAGDGDGDGSGSGDGDDAASTMAVAVGAVVVALAAAASVAL